MLPCEQLAKSIRRETVKMIHKGRASHVGSCLSIADILAVLYAGTLRVRPDEPEWSERDRFILSKGHAAAALYAVLAIQGFFSKSDLEGYSQEDSLLIGHASHLVAGVEYSTGSLGHGLSVGCGIALWFQRASLPQRVFVLLSDGELNEGSNWEAILFASHHKLDNLTAIIDYNKMQAMGRTADILKMDPLAGKFSSFGWVAREIDGHNLTEIAQEMNCLPFKPGHPSVLIAHTVKGKGVPFMENNLLWHYRTPSDQDLLQALWEIGE